MPPSLPSLLQVMCWDWLWEILKSALQSPTQEAMTQTDASFFQQCDCCTVPFSLAGDESLAAACGICNRRICYMCSASLAWDESIGKLVNICDDCREEYLVAGFTGKLDARKLCVRV